MKFNHNRHVVERFEYDIKGFDKMIGMQGDQVLDHSTEAFLPNTEAQLLKIDDIDVEIGKARVFVLLLKSELA